MTHLECGAVNCAHNRARLCALGEIEVSGSGAQYGSDTCCRSFSEGDRAFSNSAAERDGEGETYVECDAETCAYNSGGVCDAEDILIEGAYANRKDATSCDSFVARD